MSRKGVDNRDQNDRRQDALRRCGLLGYECDRPAMHLPERGAFEIAETQFRRAVGLNPFEPRFKTRLARCLYKQGRHADALACLAEAPDADMDADMQTVARLAGQGVSRKSVTGG